MPGHLVNNGGDDINPFPRGGFDPRNGNQWRWVVGDHAPDDDTVSQEGGESFMSGWLLNHDLLPDAIAWFVGWAKLSGQTRKVTRWNPAYHPRNRFMRCSGLSVKGMIVDGTEHVIGNILPNRTLDNPVYERYQFDIRWKQYDFDFREDGEVSTEWERCLKVEPYDLGEIITVDGGLYRYRAPSLPATLNGSPYVINGPSIKLYAERVGLRVTSWGLPAAFILDSYGCPNNFMHAKGKVNSTTFLNRPAGTMLLQNYEIKLVAQPVTTRQLGSLAYNVFITMDFAFTNPPRAEGTETLRGWQLVPGPNGPTSAGWYAVLTAGGQTLYETYDMNRLLEYRDDT